MPKWGVQLRYGAGQLLVFEYLVNDISFNGIENGTDLAVELDELLVSDLSLRENDSFFSESVVHLHDRVEF